MARGQRGLREPHRSPDLDQRLSSLQKVTECYLFFINPEASLWRRSKDGCMLGRQNLYIYIYIYFFGVPGMEPRASYMLSKGCTTELHPPA
jgi:hypothetical protein